MLNSREFGAEFIGTFTLVTAVCGAGLFSVPSAGVEAMALAVGFSVLVMGYAVGSISGGHFNPAVTLGLVAAGRFPLNRAWVYIVAQVIGGAVAAAVFYYILAGAPGGKWNNFTAISNIYGGATHFTLLSSALIEIVITALFLAVIVCASSRAQGFAPLAIGLALVLFHLVAVPVTNASLNPARSTATALFAGGDAIATLWLFWVAPIIGGLIGGYGGKWLLSEYVPGRAKTKRRVAKKR